MRKAYKTLSVDQIRLASQGEASPSKLEHLPLSALRLYPGNAKQHGAKQIRALAKGISELGFLNPIIVDGENEILAGHGRHAAAQLAGLLTVPVIRHSHLSEAQKKAYRIADNRLSEFDTSFSMEQLEIEVASILQLDQDFDLSLTGFDERTLGIQFDTSAAQRDEQDEVPPLPTQAVSRLGDVWRIGEHRLICGDAKDGTVYRQLLGREKADMVFADPPYGVAIAGHVSGLGKHKHREFVEGGPMPDAELQQFLLGFMLLCARFARSGALHYVCMDWRHLKPLLLAGAVAYDEQINLCTWVKTNAGMGSLYRSQHELIAIFKSGSGSHTNTVELGRNGRNRTNVWTYAGMTAPTADRDALLALHPTVKPLALVRDAILDVTLRGGLVLDPFGGSGTTLIAAAKAGRRAALIELDPLYCDVILQRSAQTLGIVPILAATGEPWDTVVASREADHGRG